MPSRNPQRSGRLSLQVAFSSDDVAALELLSESLTPKPSPETLVREIVRIALEIPGMTRRMIEVRRREQLRARYEELTTQQEFTTKDIAAAVDVLEKNNPSAKCAGCGTKLYVLIPPGAQLPSPDDIRCDECSPSAF